VAEEAFCLKSAPADNVAYKYNTMKCVIVRLNVVPSGVFIESTFNSHSYLLCCLFSFKLVASPFTFQVKFKSQRVY